ncbi:hypothetical protein ALUC_70892A [Aspergillus luchuensis]|nr:hypothetical protein ALUC_70892A [Aspergillus luchuensis]
MEVHHPTLGDLRALVNTFCNIELRRIPAKVVVRTGSITGIYAGLVEIKKGIESA